METPHSLTVESLKKVTATAIDSVDAFSDKQIVLSFQGGRIVVAGNGMKIVNFSKTSGGFTAVGEILSVKYLGKHTGFKQKLFK